VKIAILGGTGSFGRALAARLVALGEDDVVIGSRDGERARETAAELGGARVSGATNEDAVRGVDLAVLAVKAEGALDTARAVARTLGETPLLSVASAIEFRKGVGMLPDPDARSLAERVQDIVAAPVVAGLHSVAAANLEEQPDEDALVCGDDGAAKELALELAAKLVAGRALDAGPLASARALEGLTAVIVNLNRRYKAHAGVRVTGVE
jgi:8-hydroxy-5-deazaflavin:NADPH oxidoreductase